MTAPLPRLACLALLLAPLLGAALTPVPDRAPPRMPDVLVPVEPGDVHVDGWLGRRIDANVSHRLAAMDLAPLLAGFQHRPGEQPWIGEHIGKWLHAATLAWAYTGDPALRTKIDGAVRDLLATQEPDGYLGTYAPGKRFGLYPDADWDVWVHKYDLIGLLTYYRFTGNPAALAGARRVGDLLLATFPAQRSILSAGTHVGMAATSVLEPMVLLYRATGDERYLAFARYLVRAYDENGGPGLVRSLLEPRGVDHTANGKAYEMMSNLVGLCELARTTGDRPLLAAVENAWDDIVRRRLYLTGTTSTHEHFGADHELPNGNDADVGETCVTTTWFQLNLQLLRLTGEARFGDELERTLYNHLAAAQNPRGDDWCYFTPLEGTKPYDRGITCCHSSGPRGIALSPSTAYLTTTDAVCVNTLETSRARVLLGSTAVGVEQVGGFPREGRSTITLHLAQPTRFALKIRVPTWAAPLEADGRNLEAGWVTLGDKEWREGDAVTFTYRLGGRVIAGEFGNYGKSALAWGPFILAADETANPGLGSLQALRVRPNAAIELAPPADYLEFIVRAQGTWDDGPRALNLRTFADAGAEGKSFRVWLRTY